MYPISHKYLGMKSSTQQDLFRETLKQFYKVALYDTQEYEEFESGLRKLSLDKKDEHTLINLSSYISKFISIKNPSVKKQSLFKSTKTTDASNVIAALLLNNNDFLKDLKQGGRHNFINYVELSIAEVLTKDNSLKVLFQYQKQETMKSVREMQYFRHVAPDQLLR